MVSPPGPSVSNEEIAATYDRIATLYDWAIAPMGSGPRRRTLELLSVEPGDRVLEIGCGPGHALIPLDRRVDGSGRVVGLDAAPGMVRRASARAERSEVGGRVDLLLGDARSLPFPDGAVDVVFVEDTIELFSDVEIRTVLGECDRVLGSTGRIGIVTMERDGVEGDPFVRAYEWLYETVPGYDRVGCRPIYARRALETAGFVIDHREHHRRGYVWPVEILIGHVD